MTVITIEQAREKLSSCNSYLRLPTLLSLVGAIEDSDWLRLLGEEWSSCDNIGLYLDDLWLSPLGMSDGVIQEMMTAEELSLFHALPDVFTIYRGCYKKNKHGLSWSLSEKVAEKFPTLMRFFQKGSPILVTAEVRKSAVIAIKLDRKEQEVIVYRPKIISTRNIIQQENTAP